MCGIVGYIGERQAADVLVKGLSRLEYRGYDSAGVAVVNGSLEVRKKTGKVSALSADILNSYPKGQLGIGHTRWATHGAPNDTNAHPHESSDGSFALVHNGIIENYTALRQSLTDRGYSFKSQTDTEVLVRLIEDVLKTTGLSLGKAIQQALSQVAGTYGIAVVSSEDPDMLIAARKGSPLILGVGNGEYFLGSDAAPIIEYTRQVVYLNDGELVIVRRDGFKVFSVENVALNKTIHELEWDLEQIEKGGYEHFMLKEIMEQPQALENAMRGRVREELPIIKLGGLIDHIDSLREAKRIIICACGTSWHAALVGEYLIESLARIPVEVEYASEFRYRDPILRKGDAVFVISQSGETADTLEALNNAKKINNQINTLCITNSSESSISRISDLTFLTHAGPEIGVASTKAFSTQLVALALLTCSIGSIKGSISEIQEKEIVDGLKRLPGLINEALLQEDQIKKLAVRFKNKTSALFLGRGTMHAIALEGALKLKEISYIHAEAYPAGELKHGPIALIDKNMPVIAIAPNDELLEKLKANLQEVKSRGSQMIVFEDENSKVNPMNAMEIIPITSNLGRITAPIIFTIPLQLLSYHVALSRGADVDKPRNLAKSVTVE